MVWCKHNVTAGRRLQQRTLDSESADGLRAAITMCETPLNKYHPDPGDEEQAGHIFGHFLQTPHHRTKE